MKVNDLVQLQRTVHHGSGVLHAGIVGTVITKQYYQTRPGLLPPGCCTVLFTSPPRLIACHQEELEVLNESG